MPLSLTAGSLNSTMRESLAGEGRANPTICHGPVNEVAVLPQYQPDNCPYDPDEFTVPASEVIRRSGRDSSSVARWRTLPVTHPYHLYGFKKGREWYYRPQDVDEQENRIRRSSSASGVSEFRQSP
jgi:hypothetical protein